MIAIRCVVFSVTAIVQDSVKRVFKTRFITIMFLYKRVSKGCLRQGVSLLCLCTRQCQKGV